MSENFTNTDLLIQYLDGELRGEQLTAVEEKIAADSNLAAELERLRLSKAAVQTYGLKKKIGSLHQEMMKELHTQPEQAPVVKMRNWLKYSARIAAVLLLLAGSFTLFQYYASTPQTLFESRFERYQPNDMRGAADSNLLMNDYKNGRMHELQAAFKHLSNPTIKDFFLYGNASLQLHDAPAAIAAFQSAQQLNTINQSHIFEEDLNYFLALAYLGNNQSKQALPIFEEIYKDTAHPYHKKINGWFIQRLRRLAH